MNQLHELRSLVAKYGREGATETAIAGLTLYIESDPEVVTYVVHQPVLALILGGGKRTMLGGRVFDVSVGDCVAVSVDLPASGQVTEAPYSALTLALDANVIGSLMVGSAAPTSGPTAAVQVHRAGLDLLDSMLRLVRLLDHAEDVAVLAPLIQREVLWRLLRSPSGPLIRQIVLADSRLSRVNLAINWLRANFAVPTRIDRLAALARMSPASFHRHFKAATGMTPLEYRKQIQLQTARARLLAKPGDVAGVGFGVGYDSPSQFSREYARLFGASPGRDAARLRARLLDRASDDGAGSGHSH